jgi:hypothetical protein
MGKQLSIGVVGYCLPTKFDEAEAVRMLAEAYDKIEEQFPDTPKMVVSGLTNVGVLKLAYEEAVRRGWRTKGVACKLAADHPLFPVDEQCIVGENWGDESQEFLRDLNCMVRIGVGKQSLEECAIISGRGLPTYEYNLPVL